VFVGEGGCGAGVGEGEGGEQEREEVVEGHVLVIGGRGWGCKAGAQRAEGRGLRAEG
jgi:hypothetical protein